MSYCTQQELIDRYGETELIQLTDRDNIGAIDTTVLGRAIADADGEIDGHLGSRFSVPLATVPKSVQRVACDIARYYLYDDAAPEHISERYKNAVEFLRGVASGRISIGVTDTGSKPSPSNGATIESGGSVFGREDKGFI